MRTIMHDLNSLRDIVRRLQEDNANLKKILDEHDISYDFEEIMVNTYMSTARNMLQSSSSIWKRNTEPLGNKLVLIIFRLRLLQKEKVL